MQENVQKAFRKLNSMSNAFFRRLVPSEALVLKTPDLTVSLKKVIPSDVPGLSMEDGPAKFKLPTKLGSADVGNVNVMVRKSNSWSNIRRSILRSKKKSKDQCQG